MVSRGMRLSPFLLGRLGSYLASRWPRIRRPYHFHLLEWCSLNVLIQLAAADTYTFFSSSVCLRLTIEFIFAPDKHAFGRPANERAQNTLLPSARAERARGLCLGRLIAFLSGCDSISLFGRVQEKP